MTEEPARPIKRKTPRPTPAPGRSRRVVNWVLGLVAAFVLIDSIVGDRGLIALFQARRQHEDLASSIARLRLDNGRLREEARRLREDPSAIEEIARRELGLIKPGEKLFIVKDAPQPTSRPTRP